MFYIWPVKVAVMLLILRTGAKAAPTERGERETVNTPHQDTRVKHKNVTYAQLLKLE